MASADNSFEVLFIGSENSGKSSLVRNLMKLYDVVDSSNSSPKTGDSPHIVDSSIWKAVAAEEAGIDLSFSKGEPFVVRRESVALPTSGVDNQSIHLTPEHFTKSSATPTASKMIPKKYLKLVKLREIGSGIGLASNWGSYISTASIVAFVVDTSDNSSLGTSIALLHETLNFINDNYITDMNFASSGSGGGGGGGSSSTCKSSVIVVICMSKCDRCSTGTLQSVHRLLNVDELGSFFKGRLKIMYGNSVDTSLSKALYDLTIDAVLES